MATSNLNLGKASGGVLNITPTDGVTNTNLVLPESGTVVATNVVVTDNAIARYDGTTGKVKNSAITIDNSGNIGSGTQSFNGFGGSGFKNYIINGSFDIDQYQRGTQSNWNSASCYIDRFLVFNSSSVVRNSAGANNPIGTGLCNHLSVTKTAGADTQIIQRWEIPKDKAKQFLNGRTLTFSCWVLAGTANFVEHLFFIKNGTSANSYEVKAFNITKNNVANIWTRVTGTITNIQWTYEAGEYIEIRLDPANVVAGELHTTGWQLEEGSVATPFEQRPYGLELSLCQRYYQLGEGTIKKHSASSNHQGTQPLSIPYFMRVSPTLSFSKTGIITGTNALDYSTSSSSLYIFGGSAYGSAAVGDYTFFSFTASAEL